jgi:hypothetical protein
MARNARDNEKAPAKGEENFSDEIITHYKWRRKGKKTFFEEILIKEPSKPAANLRLRSFNDFPEATTARAKL